MSEIRIRHGLPRGQEGRAATLYDGAFGRKLRPIMPDPARRRAVIAASLDHDRAFVALRDGQVVGLAGFHADGRALTHGGDLRTVIRHLGFFGALRAAAGLALFERRPAPGELLMDGIAVDPDCRGLGIGTRLLRALVDYAAETGLETIRLDVIDTNPRARALYEREGFVAGVTERHRWLKPIFGFEASTTMHRTVQKRG